MKNTVNTATAKTAVKKFSKAGLTAAINHGMFGYTYKTRSYWFQICKDGALLFDHCFSSITGKVSKDVPTRDAAYNRMELVAGIAPLEVIA